MFWIWKSLHFSGPHSSSLKWKILISPDKYPKLDFVDCVVDLFFFFEDLHTVFRRSCTSLLPTNGAQGFPFLHILVWLFNNSQSFWHMIAHCGFDLHFLDDLWRWPSFHKSTGHKSTGYLYAIFGKNVCSCPVPNFKLVFFLILVVWVLLIF